MPGPPVGWRRGTSQALVHYLLILVLFIMLAERIYLVGFVCLFVWLMTD